jgi:hypothetical protein
MGAFVVGVTLFYFIGGQALLLSVWTGTEHGNYFWVIITSAAGVPPGALIGVNLWAKLMRKMSFISDEQIKRMSTGAS